LRESDQPNANKDDRGSSNARDREGAAALKVGHCGAGGGGLRAALNAASHNRSGLRSPSFASSMILLATFSAIGSVRFTRRATQVISNARGPKPTGKGLLVAVRCHPEFLAALDRWIDEAAAPARSSRQAHEAAGDPMASRAGAHSSKEPARLITAATFGFVRDIYSDGGGWMHLVMFMPGASTGRRQRWPRRPDDRCDRATRAILDVP
jgi:hypothetical protein